MRKGEGRGGRGGKGCVGWVEEDYQGVKDDNGRERDFFVEGASGLGTH